MRLPDRDRQDAIDRYSERYREHGYSPRTLGWDKGKQELRFEVLTSLYDFRGKSVLDIGCGFGDLNRELRRRCGADYGYLGIDLVEALVEKARELYEGPGVRFRVGDFLVEDLPAGFDFSVASGVFNHRLRGADSYAVIEACMRKALGLCRDGLAFDFLSDRVDYPLEHTFHSSPERILTIAYRLSRNVVLRNDYMPFEFSVFVFKDDSFSSEDTVFNRYARERRRGWSPGSQGV